MRSLLLVVLSNFRRRKGQNLLIGIVIGVSALLFATALGTMGSMHRPFETMFERQNVPHLVLLFDTRLNDADEITRWWESREGVADTTGIIVTMNGRNKVIFAGEELNANVMLSEMPAGDIRVDQLQIVEGEKVSSPGRGEVWLPTAFAYSHRINLGDVIEIENEGEVARLTVSSIVVDPYYSSGFVSPERVWVGNGELARLFDVEELTSVTLGIRLTDAELENSLWKEFESHLGAPFAGGRINHEMVRFAYLMLLNIISAVMMVFSVVIVAITLYIIYSTIATTVIADFKDIGILKSQGITSGGVISVYLLQYGLLSITAVILGLVGSFFTTRLLLGSMTKSLGMMSFDPALLLPYLVATLIIVSAVVLLSAFLSARAAGRIKPAQAIRFGAPAQNFSRSRVISFKAFNRLPVPALLGLKQAVTDRKQGLFTFIFFAVTTFVLVFSVNSYVSVVGMADNLPMWGYYQSDLDLIRESAADGPSHETILEELKADYRIKQVVPLGWVGTGIIPETDDRPSQNILGHVYDGDLHEIKMLNLTGEHPVRDNEIALAVNTARQYGVEVGDEFALYINGELFDFNVTGIYQNVDNMGQGYRIQFSAYQKAAPEAELMNYALILTEDGLRDRDGIIANYQNKYGEAVTAIKPEEHMGSTFEVITLNVGIAMAILSIVFLIVLAVIIVNTTVLNIQREKKIYGIMKSSGMTPGGLRHSLLARTVIAALPGIIVGVPAGLWLAPNILSVVMLEMGIANYPAVIHLPGTLGAVVAALAIAALSTYVPSGKVMTISSRNLIVE